MEPLVCLVELPKPFWQQLLNSIDASAKFRLRSCSKDVLGLVDELCSVGCCMADETITSRRLQIISSLCVGVTTLLLPELKLVPTADDTFRTTGAFTRLGNLVINYRLTNLLHALAAAAGPALHSLTVVPGKRKGSHWQAKYVRILQALPPLQSLHTLHLNLHSTLATAELVGQLQQLRSLQLAVEETARDGTPHRERMFNAELWNLSIGRLTALTSLSVSLPVLLTQQAASHLQWPTTLQSVQLHMQHIDTEADLHIDGGTAGVTGLAAAQLLLHNLPPLTQLTRVVISSRSPHDWFAALEPQLSTKSVVALGRLTQLRSLKLLVGHWSLSLLQLQPLTACVHLTELVLSELVMGFSEQGLDDQLGSRLSCNEAAAVATGVAAASAVPQRQQRSDSGSSGNSSTVMKVGGNSIQVPLLPQLEVLQCTTLWWRLPLVVLAPHLKTVAYKRLRNLGYGSFVLPDLQDWEEEQLPPVFEGLLQGGAGVGNAAAVDGQAAGGEPAVDAAFDGPLGGLAIILAPQGGFHPDNQQHHDQPPAPAAAALPGNADQQQQHAVQALVQEHAALEQALLQLEAAAVAAVPPAAGQLQQLQQQWEQVQEVVGAAGLHGGTGQQHQLAAAQLQEIAAEQVQDNIPVDQMPAAAEGAAGVLQQQQNSQTAAHLADIQELIQQANPAMQPFMQQLMIGALAYEQVGAQIEAEEEAAHQQQLQDALQDLHHQNEQLVQPEQQQALVQWHSQQQQQHEGHAAPGVWQQLMDWDMDFDVEAAAAAAQPAQQPQQEAGVGAPAAAAAGEAADHVVINAGAVTQQQQQQQQQQPVVTPPQLADAPAERAYGDVLRGQRCLESLDVCVTALCKIMRSSSSPLSQLQRLRLHMLGEVRLAPGGLPMLPRLTELEFYLPDERNWDADYNDYEDIALWQNQHNVRSIVVRGTFHAGGFFAPGHLDVAHRCMPLVQRLHFVNCGDLHTDRLQQVVDSHLAPLVVVEACGASSSNARVAAAAAVANQTAGPGSVPAAMDADGQADSTEELPGLLDFPFDGLDDVGSEDSQLAGISSSASNSVHAELTVGSEPKPVSKALVELMAVGAAAAGVVLQWIDPPEYWRRWLIGDAGC